MWTRNNWVCSKYEDFLKRIRVLFSKEIEDTRKTHNLPNKKKHQPFRPY